MHGVQEEKFSFAGYFAELLQTKEVKNAVDSGITEVITQWGEGSTARKFASKPAKWVIKKSFSGNNGNDEELLSLLKQPDLLEHLSSILPAVTNNLGEIIHAMAVSLENQAPEKQLEMLSRFFGSINPVKAGEIITSLARTADSLQQNNPNLVSGTFLSGLRKFLEHTDFSEFKTLFENAEKEIEAILSGTNDLAFEYPAKFVTLLSFLPGLSNHLLFFTGDLIKRFNNLPADILADILLSFFRETNGRTIGQFLNNLSEMIRQIHTGSALIGEAGVPQFSTELHKKSREVFKEIDPVVLGKTIWAIQDGKEVLSKTFQTIASEHPDFFITSLEGISDRNNSKIRLLKHKLELIEELDEEEAATAIATGISKLTAYDLAELVNSACELINTIHTYSPEQLKNTMIEFSSAIDTDELETCIATLTADTMEGLRPVFKTAAPILIKEVIGCLNEDGNDNEELINDARETLRRFILGGEAE